jgi:hypothetical protein
VLSRMGNHAHTANLVNILMKGLKANLGLVEGEEDKVVEVRLDRPGDDDDSDGVVNGDNDDEDDGDDDHFTKKKKNKLKSARDVLAEKFKNENATSVN